jgi:flagellar basal-body rod modification protein FlgD
MAISGNAAVTDNITTLTGKNADTQSDKAKNQLFSNYEQFVKLLTVQLQNQDPTKPLETDQLTSQIAQLSSVEQSVNTNKNLETMITLYSQSQYAGMVGYMDKMVEAPGNFGTLSGGKAPFVYNLEAEADKVDIVVTDMDGNTVRNLSGTKLAGRNQITWDGKNNSGDVMKDGSYQIKVTAKSANGDAITAIPSTIGKVTSIETIDNINYLALGDILVPISQVISVRDFPTI